MAHSMLGALLLHFALGPLCFKICLYARCHGMNCHLRMWLWHDTCYTWLKWIMMRASRSICAGNIGDEGSYLVRSMLLSMLPLLLSAPEESKINILEQGVNGVNVSPTNGPCKHCCWITAQWLFLISWSTFHIVASMLCNCSRFLSLPHPSSRTLPLFFSNFLCSNKVRVSFSPSLYSPVWGESKTIRPQRSPYPDPLQLSPPSISPSFLLLRERQEEFRKNIISAKNPTQPQEENLTPLPEAPQELAIHRGLWEWEIKMEGKLILLSVSLCCLGWMPASGQVEKVRVMFTPMVCRVHCVGDRCTNQCEKGNMTTVYSDDIARNNGEHGFRACEYDFIHYVTALHALHIECAL